MKFGLYTNEEELLAVCFANNEEDAKKIFESNDNRITKQDWENSLRAEEINFAFIDEKDSELLLKEWTDSDDDYAPSFHWDGDGCDPDDECHRKYMSFHHPRN